MNTVACSSKATVKPVTGGDVRWIVMSHKTGISNEIFQLPIEGRVTRFVVRELREAILPLIVIADEIEIEIDLLHVKEIDFVGLLLLVEVKLTAISLDKMVRFIRYGQPIAEIMGRYGLIDFFAVPQNNREIILQKLEQIPDYMSEQG